MVERMADHAATVGTPASRGLHLRAHTLAQPEPDVQALEESAGLLREVPFEGARSRPYAGQVQRRRKQLAAARRQLTGAFDAFDALGATPWRAHATVWRRARRTRRRHR